MTVNVRKFPFEGPEVRRELKIAVSMSKAIHCHRKFPGLPLKKSNHKKLLTDQLTFKRTAGLF